LKLSCNRQASFSLFHSESLYCRTWIEVRQQAAEEDLEMPVVLEEFGCKLDARPEQYKLAYDSCLTSAKRGGSCAGVMFWDLAHKVTTKIEGRQDD